MLARVFIMRLFAASKNCNQNKKTRGRSRFKPLTSGFLISQLPGGRIYIAGYTAFCPALQPCQILFCRQGISRSTLLANSTKLW